MATPAPLPTTISISAALNYLNLPIQNQSLSAPNIRASIAGKHFTAATFSVPTTTGGTAIPIGVLSSLGWALLINNDKTNRVDVLTAVNGVAFASMEPGEPLLLRFGSGVTAPALLANAESCDVEYLILEA